MFPKNVLTFFVFSFLFDTVCFFLDISGVSHQLRLGEVMFLMKDEDDISAGAGFLPRKCCILKPFACFRHPRAELNSQQLNFQEFCLSKHISCCRYIPGMDLSFQYNGSEDSDWDSWA